MFKGKAAPLSQQGINTALSRLGIDEPALWAVLAVETSGCGFLPDRQPKILFERHWFSRLTNGQFDNQAPDISSRQAGGYGSSGAYQYERLSRAIELDRTSAMESTSWGLGQVMGFNATKVGYTDVEAMVSETMTSEDAQLEAMIGFVEQANIAKYLESLDWAGFAYRYNGQDFQKNKYDEKLDLCHRRYLQGPLPNLSIRTAQLGLMLLGYGGPGFVDGWFGINTQKALTNYQQRSSIRPTGSIDDATMECICADLGW